MATNQEVAGDNTDAAAASANAVILNGTPTTEDDEDEDDNIEKVDMPQNEPTEIINVDAESDGEQNQEEQYEKPVDTLSQNQDNVPNTTYMLVITDFDATADDNTSGDNPNGAVKV